MVAGETHHFRKPPYTYASRRMVMHLALQKIAGTICRSSLRGWLDELHSRRLRLVTSPSPPGHVGKLRASCQWRKRRRKNRGGFVELVIFLRISKMGFITIKQLFGEYVLFFSKSPEAKIILGGFRGSQNWLKVWDCKIYLL